jgi:hypothetical protein
MIGETRSDPASAEVPADLVGVRPATTPSSPAPVEIGGRDGPEPTRYGDWEKNGRCIDF